MFNTSRLAHIFFIFSAAAALFFPFLGSVHLFDWDEINFAECAREMIVTGNYSSVMIDFQPFWEKPPLFIWMQVISMKIFGVNEFAARFPNAVCGLLTLLVVYRIGTKIFDSKFGLYWALSFGGSLLPFLYFKSGIIDPWFNFFIFCGIYQAVIHTNNPAGKQGMVSAVLSALFIGLATLTKGPVAVLIFGLCALVYWVRKRFIPVTNFKYIFAFIGVFVLTAGSWFIYEILAGNYKVIEEFFAYQVRLFKSEDAGHGGFFGYHFVILFLGCFPASLFAIRAWKKSSSDTPFHRHIKMWMNNLFWVVLILFSIVETKIVHYSSLCYFPLTFLSAYGIYKITQGEFKWKKWMTTLMFVISGVLATIFIAIPLIDHYKEFLLSKIKDKFTADCLRQDVIWGGWEWIPGVIFLIVSVFVILKLNNGKYKSLPALFLLMAITLFSIMAVVTPKIEQYSQGPAIEFYKTISEGKKHVETVNFKSYAHLFYAKKKPDDNTPALLDYVYGKIDSDIRTNQTIYSFQLYATNFMRGSDIDRPAYLVVKSDHAAQWANENPMFRELYRKGGFVFFKREAGKAN